MVISRLDFGKNKQQSTKVQSKTLDPVFNQSFDLKLQLPAEAESTEMEVRSQAIQVTPDYPLIER